MNFGLWMTTAAAAAVLAGGPVRAQSGSDSMASMAAPPPDAYDADISVPWAEARYRQVSEAIAPRIHVLRQTTGWPAGTLGDVTVIEQRDGLVLVDAGTSRGSGDRIVALVRAISPKPVKAVIITHWHTDHFLGLPAIVQAWPGAAIIMTQTTRDHVMDPAQVTQPHAPDPAWEAKRREALHGYALQYGPNIRDPKLSPEERVGWAQTVGVLKLRMDDAAGTYVVAPTVIFTDRYRIDDPDAPVEARMIGGGHTDSDVVVWAPKQRVLATGDLMVSPAPFPAQTMSGWEASLRRIKADYPFAVMVPGHGVPQHDSAYLDHMIGAIAEMRAKAGVLAGETLADEAIQPRIDLSRQRQIFAGDDPWIGYWFDQYFASNVVVAYHEARKAAGK